MKTWRGRATVISGWTFAHSKSNRPGARQRALMLSCGHINVQNKSDPVPLTINCYECENGQKSFRSIELEMIGLRILTS